MGKQWCESNIELTRRAFVERRECQLDLEEGYKREVAAARTREERQALGTEFALQRREYREAEIKAGRRLKNTHVLMHQIMWARWLEVAVEQEISALADFGRMRLGETKFITDEFRASLISLTAAAHTIEALYGDIKYLFPSQQPKKKRHQTLSRAFGFAFGITEDELALLSFEMRWLFELRDMAAHPYTEAGFPSLHPLGFNTGSEHADFNALTSGRAVELAMRFLTTAAAAPKYYNHWIERWAKTREPYMNTVVRPLKAQREKIKSCICKDFKPTKPDEISTN
ncbi:MAG: hypothetical protein WD425_14745 [Nitrospirales bacterium]